MSHRQTRRFEKWDASMAAYSITDLGRVICHIGQGELGVKEDRGRNNDSGGRIRVYFREGIGWRDSDYRDFERKHGYKPDWCAAFASYCIIKGYQQLSRPFPHPLHASSSGMAKVFHENRRFLPRHLVFDRHGNHRPGMHIPGPGDVVMWRNHTGLLGGIDTEGAVSAIEGNTYEDDPQDQGICTKYYPRGHHRHTNIIGFGLTASLDGFSGPPRA